MENNCVRYSNGSCLDGDFVSKCIGKDCGAYEPKTIESITQEVVVDILP